MHRGEGVTGGEVSKLSSSLSQTRLICGPLPVRLFSGSPSLHDMLLIRQRGKSAAESVLFDPPHPPSNTPTSYQTPLTLKPTANPNLLGLHMLQRNRNPWHRSCGEEITSWMDECECHWERKKYLSYIRGNQRFLMFGPFTTKRTWLVKPQTHKPSCNLWSGFPFFPPTNAGIHLVLVVT